MCAEFHPSRIEYLKAQIPPQELSYVYSRSSGPGGQNVNKVSTRVTLHFDLSGTDRLSPDQKRRIRRVMPGRISGRGILRVVSSRFRTQPANRRAATERFYDLLADALEERPTRRRTSIPRAQRKKRITDKKLRAERKRLRKPLGDAEH